MDKKNQKFIKALEGEGDPLEAFEALSGGNAGGVGPKRMAKIRQTQKYISEYSMPLTVRQVYYKFVTDKLIEPDTATSKRRSYKAIDSMLVLAREAGLIPYDSIVDLTRTVRKRSSWDNTANFLRTVKTAYGRDKMQDQEVRIEVWVEKDTLVGQFEPITNKYDINLISGRGYQSLSALSEASKRQNADKTEKILYFGDFDPSGEDMFRSIQEKMRFQFGGKQTAEKVTLTFEDISRYKLSTIAVKTNDTRANAHLEKYGNIAAEIEALPPDVLVRKLEDSILENIDPEKFDAQKEYEAQDIEDIEKLIEEIE